VTANWKLRGLPWLAASIRLSQAAFKLLYLSEKSEREQLSSESEIEYRNRMKMMILPPINTSKLMRRWHLAWQRAVMSRRSCSRCRMRRRNW
jgi:hypothetical protein